MCWEHMSVCQAQNVQVKIVNSHTFVQNDTKKFGTCPLSGSIDSVFSPSTSVTESSLSSVCSASWGVSMVWTLLTEAPQGLYSDDRTIVAPDTKPFFAVRQFHHSCKILAVLVGQNWSIGAQSIRKIYLLRTILRTANPVARRSFIGIREALSLLYNSSNCIRWRPYTYVSFLSELDFVCLVILPNGPGGLRSEGQWPENLSENDMVIATSVSQS
jgi:hypothetical protein